MQKPKYFMAFVLIEIVPQNRGFTNNEKTIS